MGEVPGWYRLIQAARYLETTPWDLAKQSMVWIEWAEEAQAAEEHARHQKKNMNR